MSDIKRCVCCEGTYKYCGHCNKNAKQESWKNLFCSENCRDIFRTLQDYVNGHLGIAEAKEKLLGLDLNINTTKQLNKNITEIMAYEVPQPKVVAEEVIPVVEEEQPRRRPRRRRGKRTEE